MVMRLAIALLVLLPSSSSAWIMIHPRHHITPTTMTTRLKYNNDDDFASLSNSEAEEEGLRLAREFYNELQVRGRGRSDIQSLYDYDTDDDDENGVSSKSGDEGANSGNTGSSWMRRTSSSRTFVNNNQSSPSSSSSSSSSPRETSLEALFSFFSSFDSSRRTTSAGLFSGSGISVYSPGRSLRAEIELLETIMNKNDAATDISKNNDSSIDYNDTVRNGIYIGTLSLVVLSAISSGVGMDLIMTSDYSPVASLEDAFASLNHLLAIIDDVTREGISSVMIIANNGEVFMNEEAHWLMRESSELAATFVDTMHRSVEELVMK